MLRNAREVEGGHLDAAVERLVSHLPTLLDTPRHPLKRPGTTAFDPPGCHGYFQASGTPPPAGGPRGAVAVRTKKGRPKGGPNLPKFTPPAAGSIVVLAELLLFLLQSPAILPFQNGPQQSAHERWRIFAKKLRGPLGHLGNVRLDPQRNGARLRTVLLCHTVPHSASCGTGGTLGGQCSRHGSLLPSRITKPLNRTQLPRNRQGPTDKKSPVKNLA